MKNHSFKKRLSTAILAGVLFVSGVLAGCSTNNGEQSAMPTINISTTTSGGLQQISVSETNYDFIRDGQTDYQIVIPEDASSIVKNAAQEFSLFTYEATAVSLPIVKDTGLTYSEDVKYISFGNNNVSEAAGVKANYDTVKSNGYIIKTVGKSVFCIGGGDYGTLYSAYEFLEHAFGYQLYATDEIAIETGVKNKKLPNFDIAVRPTFEWRHTAFEKVDGNSTNRMRFRELAPNEMFIKVNGSNWCHNALSYIPYNEENKTNHPEWFSSNAATDPDLCYSNEGTLEEVVKQLKEDIVAQPERELVTISSPDGQKNWCACEKCLANYNKYGTNAATIIQFCNKVNKAIKEWIANELKTERHVEIIFLGYGMTRQPPIREVNDKYVPIDDTVVCDEGVSVFLTAACTGGNFLTDADMQQLHEAAEQWKVLSPHKFNYWIYTENYQHYLPFADSFGSVYGAYQFASEKDTFFMLNNSQDNTKESTGFCNLKAYLDYELMWNCNQSMDVLIDDFFANYFKDANEPMRKLFNALRAISSYQREVQNTTLVNYNIAQAQFYPMPFLEKCMDYIDEAYAAIEPLKKKNAELYETLYNRINLESLSIRYLMIHIYGTSFSDSELLDMKLTFKADAEWLKVDRLAETSLITSLWAQWNI